jgi:hypothetical protein
MRGAIKKDLRVFVNEVLDANVGLSRQQLVVIAAHLARSKGMTPVDALLALKGNGEVPKEDIDQLIEHINEGN